MASNEESRQESSKAKRAYEIYESMGPDRSLAKVAEQLGHTPGYRRVLEGWSSTFGWVKRANAWDEKQREKRRREIEAEREKIDKEHLLLGRTHALIAVQMIQKLKEKEEYSLSAANQLLKISTDLQRLAIGSATQQIALTGKDGGPVDVDVVVETFWGRGTDPRRKSPEINETPKTVEEDDDSDEDMEDWEDDGDEENP